MAIHHLASDWMIDHPAVRCDGFFSPVSFSAYDAVFLDPNEISRHWTETVRPQGDGVRRSDPTRDHGFGHTLSAWMRRRRDEVNGLLKRGGGILVCRMSPRGEPIEIAAPGDPAERIDRYSWIPSVSLVDRHHQLTFPSNGRFVARRGSDVVFEGTGTPFEEYLRRFEGRIVYRAIYQDLLSTPLERFATVLARNRIGDVLALEIPYDEGRLVLLPTIEGVSPSLEGAALMEAVRNSAYRPAFAPPPDWLPAYPLPGEDSLVDELSGLIERRETLSAKIEEVSARLKEKSRHKKLLYTRGRLTFGSSTAEAFESLGFEVDSDAKVLTLRSANGDALVVASAADEARVDLPAYRRLRDAVDRAVTDGETPHKGILVVSGSRDLDPKRRPTQYEAGVLRGCEAQGFCIITSYQLFKLVQRSLEDPSKKNLAALRRGLLECDGAYRDAGTQ